MILVLPSLRACTQCTFRLLQAAESARKTVEQPQENRQSQHSETRPSIYTSWAKPTSALPSLSKLKRSPAPVLALLLVSVSCSLNAAVAVRKGRSQSWINHQSRSALSFFWVRCMDLSWQALGSWSSGLLNREWRGKGALQYCFSVGKDWEMVIEVTSETLIDTEKCLWDFHRQKVSVETFLWGQTDWSPA